MSKPQQQAQGAALSAGRGEARAWNLQGASRGLHDGMSEEEPEALASTKTDDLPGRKDG